MRIKLSLCATLALLATGCSSAAVSDQQAQPNPAPPAGAEASSAPAVTAAPAPTDGSWYFQAVNRSDNPGSVVIVETPPVKAGWHVDYTYDCRPRVDPTAATFYVDVHASNMVGESTHGVVYIDNVAQTHPDNGSGQAGDKLGTGAGNLLRFIVGGPCAFSLRLDPSVLVQPYTGPAPAAIGYQPGHQFLTQSGGGGSTQVAVRPINSAWRLDWQYQCGGQGSFLVYGGLLPTVNRRGSGNRGSFESARHDDALLTVEAAAGCTWTITATTL